ncbi:MAG: amidase [Gemmatimonadaceae bacterium]|nr:amidase [Gemmatimonadaceae bacterium]
MASILDRDTLNAFCRHTHVERAPTRTGALSGLTFGLKDLFDVAGERSGFGSPDWLRTHDAASEDSWVLRVLLDAGAHMVGRTHTEEMAFSLTGENAHYGTPRNPRAPGRVPGGSSSGSAVAVAGGLVDFAIGSDTGGSVRAPSSFCGIFGMRPTHGLLPLAGACPLAPMFDTVGWFARDAHMLARVGTVLCDAAGVAPEEGDVRPARVLVAQDALDLVVPESRPVLEAAVQRVALQLASQASVETVTLAPEGLRAWYDVFRVLQWADIWRTHGAWVERVRPTFGPQIAPRFEAASRVTADEVRDADQARLHIVARLDSLLAGDTVLVLPTVPDVAPRLALPPAETVAVREQALQLLCSAGLGGLPQISMPIAERDGLPMGVSLLAGRGRDRWLLELAQRMS